MQRGPYREAPTATIPGCPPLAPRFCPHECRRAAARRRVARRRTRRVGPTRSTGAGPRSRRVRGGAHGSARASADRADARRQVDRARAHADARRRAADVEGTRHAAGVVLAAVADGGVCRRHVDIDRWTRRGDAADRPRRSPTAFRRPLAGDAPGIDADAHLVDGDRCRRGVRGRVAHVIRGVSPGGGSRLPDGRLGGAAVGEPATIDRRAASDRPGGLVTCRGDGRHATDARGGRTRWRCRRGARRTADEATGQDGTYVAIRRAGRRLGRRHREPRLPPAGPR